MSKTRFETIEHICQQFPGTTVQIIEQEIGTYVHFQFARELNIGDWRAFATSVLMQTHLAPGTVRWHWSHRDIVVHQATFVEPPE